MTDLERFAAALLAQWRGEGGAGGGPIAVNALLDRTLPYRVARRLLGIDVSEDYEALMLRLLGEEEGLANVTPVGAAEMARTTMSSKLPDLDVLQLLRSATLTLTDDALARLEGVLPLPTPKDESKWAPADDDATDTAAMPDHDVIPLHAVREPVAPAARPVETGPPPEFLTTVAFTPPGNEHCWSCVELLPPGRVVKFCPFCGADQRQPACAACGAAVERRWKHCPECGVKLWGEK